MATTTGGGTVASRYARVQKRLANITRVVRVRSEDSTRSTNHGGSNGGGSVLGRQEVAVSRLEELVVRMEETLGVDPE